MGVCKCQKCEFNKSRDWGPTIQGLGRDVQKMIDTGTVESNGAEIIYNQIEEIEGVGAKICDDFDMLVISRYLHEAGITPNKGTGSSQPAGGTAPVQSSGAQSE